MPEDRRTGDPLHRLVHELEAEPELPPDEEQTARWEKHMDDPRVIASFNRAFPTNQDDVQGYDEEWRMHLAELHKEFHGGS